MLTRDTRGSDRISRECQRATHVAPIVFLERPRSQKTSHRFLRCHEITGLLSLVAQGAVSAPLRPKGAAAGTSDSVHDVQGSPGFQGSGTKLRSFEYTLSPRIGLQTPKRTEAQPENRGGASGLQESAVYRVCFERTRRHIDSLSS